MRYNIVESGMIRGGSLEVNLTLLEDTYQADWSADIKLGKRVFGKWLPLPGFSKSGSERIPKDLLSEEYIRTNDTLSVKGYVFTKQAMDHFTTGQNNDVNIDLFFRFDANDPAEIVTIYVEWNNFKVTAILE
jgi:hypothetical protein